MLNLHHPSHLSTIVGSVNTGADRMTVSALTKKTKVNIAFHPSLRRDHSTSGKPFVFPFAYSQVEFAQAECENTNLPRLVDRRKSLE